MPKKLVSTHHEVRWSISGYGSGKPGDYVEAFKDENSQADAKIFAMQRALELGKTNKGDQYTRVAVHEVETHEEVIVAYTAQGVRTDLQQPAVDNGRPSTPSFHEDSIHGKD